MELERIDSILQGFGELSVAVVGDVVLDHYIHGKVERLNPEAPVPILHAGKETEMTGGAGNTAKNAAGLGVATVLVSVVGDDLAAQNIAEAAKRENYTLRLVKDPDRPTIRKVRHMVGNQQLLRVDYEKTHNITPDIEEALIKQLEAVVAEGVKAIIVSDYAKGSITEKVAKAILKLGQEHNIIIAADIKPSRAAFFKGATFISPNLKEGHEYLGLNPLEQGGKQAEDLAPLLHKKMQTDVYLTLGAGGVYVCTDNITQAVPQEHVVEVFDVSGAGDTAVVALTLAQLCGASPVEAATIANAAGAVVVEKVGSVGLSVQELRDMLLHRHG